MLVLIIRLFHSHYNQSENSVGWNNGYVKAVFKKKKSHRTNEITDSVVTENEQKQRIRKKGKGCCRAGMFGGEYLWTSAHN